MDFGAMVGFLGLDLFGYLWHRANHAFSFLWRFHAIHHSDSAMDVTSSGRFHFMEFCIAGLARLPVLILLGVSPEVLVGYETTLVAVSMLHHSTINLGPGTKPFGGSSSPPGSIPFITPMIRSIMGSTLHRFFPFGTAFLEPFFGQKPGLCMAFLVLKKMLNNPSGSC